MFDDLSTKNAPLLKTNKDMCEANKDLTHNLEIQNTNLKMVEKELLLVRESLGNRPTKTIQTINGLINENVVVRKILSNSNIKEKPLYLLIKKILGVIMINQY